MSERTADAAVAGDTASDRSLFALVADMRWAEVASRDLLEARRGRTLLALALLVPLVTFVPPWLRWYTHWDPPLPAAQALFTITGVLAVVLPLVVMVAVYGSLLAERQAGRIRVTLGLPLSRLEVFAGKYAGRTVLVLGTLAASLALTGVFVALTHAPFSLAALFGVGFVTLLYGAVWVGLGLAVSGSVSSTARGVAGLFGVYAMFRIGGPALQYALLRLTDARRYAPFPDWYYAIGRLNPMNAYVRAVQPFMGEAGRFHPLLSAGEGAQTLWTSFEVALLVLVGWVVLAPTVGYLLFQRADLD